MSKFYYVEILCTIGNPYHSGVPFFTENGLLEVTDDYVIYGPSDQYGYYETFENLKEFKRFTGKGYFKLMELE